MKFLQSVTVDHIVFGILSCFFIIGTLLGDGKQPIIIDAVTSVVVISLYILSSQYLHKERQLPQSISLLWIINIGYWILRSIFSDSIAYSITTSMRFIMTYLIFTFFYEYGTRSHQRYFVITLIFFSLTASMFSLFFLLFPRYALNLPSMNLLYPYYGHNHLSNILIIVYPITLTLILQMSYNIHKIRYIGAIGYFLFVFSFIILSLSRGAIVIVGLYTMLCTGLYIQRNAEIKHIVLLFIGCFGIISFFLFSLFTVYQQKIPVPILQQQLQKPKLIEDGRLRYWQQALDGIKERPLFGSGPGTFYLISKRYQHAPNNYSWFAHNSMLQWIVELGIIGSLLLFTLFGTMIAKMNLSHPLAHGAFLAFLNSLFDYNLDFLIIWIIVWIILGLSIKR